MRRVVSLPTRHMTASIGLKRSLTGSVCHLVLTVYTVRQSGD